LTSIHLYIHFSFCCRIWDLESKKELKSLQRDEEIISVYKSEASDQYYGIIKMLERTVAIDTETEKELFEYKTNGQQITRMSPDTNRMVVLSFDLEIDKYRVAILDTSCDVPVRNTVVC